MRRVHLPLSPLEFARRARKLYPEREAVVDGPLRLSYAQFFDRCDRWSSALQGMGVRKGDRVAYIAPNTHAQLESFYAVPQLGAVLVPINYRLTADDFAYIIGSLMQRPRTQPAVPAALEVKFDTGDAAWLAGYSHALMALCDSPLAHDFHATYDAAFHRFFPRSETPLASALAQPHQSAAVGEPCGQRVGKRMGVVVFEYQLRIDLPDKLGGTTARSAEHRHATGHALQDGQRKILECARAHLQVSGSHQRPQTGRVAVPGELDSIRHAVGGDEVLETGAFGARTGDHQSRL